MWVYDLESLAFLAVNAAAFALYGYSREEFLAMTIRDIRPPEDLPALEKNLAAAPHGFEESGAWRHRAKDGGIIEVEITSHTLEFDGRRARLVLALDVTERKRAERVLLQNEERHRALFEATETVVWLTTPEGNVVFATDKWNQITGQTDEERSGWGWLEAIHPDDRGPTAQNWQSSLETRTLHKNEFRVRTRDGTYRWFQVRGVPIVAPDGSVREWVGANTDVHERKRANAALRASEGQLSAIYANVPGVIFYLAVEPEGNFRFLSANHAFLKATGLAEQQVVGQLVQEVLAPASLSMVLGKYHEAIRTRKVVRWDEVSASPDGERHGEVSVTPAFDATGTCTHLIGIVHEITALKRAETERLNLERQIQHTQKLESLGVLAGGIAHDFNNLLTAVMGNVSMAMMDLAPTSPVREHLLEAEKATERAADLARQMLAYSGKGRFIVQRVNLRDVVEEMVPMLQASISKKAILRFDFAEDMPTIEADVTQLRQIILNLVINASDAIGDRTGVIGISAGAMACDRSYLAATWLQDPLPEGRYGFLKVADTGCGIAPDQLSKIFDPFFTTKFTGRGLGLAAVQGIVRSHKGAIEVYTEPGKGTTFTALFPTTGEMADTPAEATAETPAWRGTGCVLLVDDEESIRVTAKRMLERLGFEVLTAEDGLRALEIFEAEGAKIVAVLLDLTMPHMDGEETCRELRLLRPEVRVILSTGYSAHDVVQRFAGQSLAGFIGKPYTLAKLRTALQQALPA